MMMISEVWLSYFAYALPLTVMLNESRQVTDDKSQLLLPFLAPSFSSQNHLDPFARRKQDVPPV